MAEVDRDASGRVAEVRLQLSPGAAWADVEPAVHRLVRAGDPTTQQVRVVPLARPRAPQLPAPTPPDPRQPRAGRAARPQIRRLDLSTVGSQITATVELAAGDLAATGTCGAVVSGGGFPRAVATATLRALEGLLGDAAHLELEHVDVSTAQEPALALVHLSLVSAEGVQLLAGAALVRHDQSDAVVRAVLDASNRRVEALLRR
jgi:hypothetical protein